MARMMSKQLQSNCKVAVLVRRAVVPRPVRKRDRRGLRRDRGVGIARVGKVDPVLDHGGGQVPLLLSGELKLVEKHPGDLEAGSENCRELERISGNCRDRSESDMKTRRQGQHSRDGQKHSLGRGCTSEPWKAPYSSVGYELTETVGWWLK